MKKNAGSSAESRRVNNLLHTLRGEQFRHAQNLQGSKAHLKRVHSRSYNNPTLPFDQIYDTAGPNPESSAPERNARDAHPPVQVGPEGILEYAYPNGAVPGPLPPRSWSGLFGKGKGREVDEPACRADTLSLVFSHTPPADVAEASSVPPLTQLCLRVLLTCYVGPAFAKELVPYFPSHLRRTLLRWTAVHSPLHSAKLYALCEPDGHVDGELIVVGPQASLQRDHLKASTSHRPRAGAGAPSNGDGDEDEENSDGEGEEDWTWDSPAAYAHAPAPLHTLILLSAALPAITLFVFPPTLTHVALLALPEPAQIHRLPHICPLVEVLDLSFNPWLGRPPGARGGERVLERVEWSRWGRLKVLGLRDCGARMDVVQKVNKGRWTDVDIIGIQVMSTPTITTGVASVAAISNNSTWD